MVLQLPFGEAASELGLRVDVRVTAHTDRDQVVEFVRAPFVTLLDMMDLKKERAEAATDAAVPRAIGEHLIDESLRDVRQGRVSSIAGVQNNTEPIVCPSR